MDIFEREIERLASPEPGAIAEVEAKLRIVVETLGALGVVAEGQRFESSLEALARAIAARVATKTRAGQLDVFQYDEERGDVWTLRHHDDGRAIEVRVPVEGGAIGETLSTGRPVRLDRDVYDDPRSRGVRRVDELTGSRSESAMLVPLSSDDGRTLGLVLATNRVGADGFDAEDEAAAEAVAPLLGSILSCLRALRAAIQRQRAVASLMQATRSIGTSGLDLEETLARVMTEAKELMDADRSTLWLVDRDAGELWTKIPAGDESREVRIPINAGFAGLVATTGRPVNIPFDLYQHPNAYTAKQVDQKTGYRTCSLLCLPVRNAEGELIGVTQLVNKKRAEEGEPYDPANWPEPPDCWKASFTRSDQEYMEAFNQQAGVALQNAKLFATVKQQEQMQRDILRSLSNGVIATDDAGRVVAVNESAREILGLEASEAVEGRYAGDLVRVEGAEFAAWLSAALEPADERSREQYYPEQTLATSDQRSVNVSINTMSDASDATRASGTLVVLDDISDERRLKTTMYRYMTQELAEQLLQSDALRLGGDRKFVSVLFSDIRSYTTLTEDMEPEDVVHLLNEYFEAMVEAIFNHKGTLDKYIGDAIMAVYGSPLPIDEHAWCAVQSAVEMRHRLEEFNARRREAGLREIQIGIGINSDEVVSGNIGSSKRMEFTAIGDGINLGSRLEGVSKLYGCDVVISDETYRLCDERAICRELDTIRVKGKNAPVSIYELVEVAEGPHVRPLSDVRRAQMEHYHAGRRYYERREFGKALAAFERTLEVTPGDKAAQLHVDRCKHLLETEPPSEWSGVWTLKEK